MTLAELNNMLEDVQDLCHDLELATGNHVTVALIEDSRSNPTYWGLSIEDREDHCIYWKDYDRLEDVRRSLDDMFTGAKLARGEEV